MVVRSLPASEGDAVWSLSINWLVVKTFLANSQSPQIHSSFLQVIDECNKAKQWLQVKIQQQNSLPKNTDPVLWSNEIKRKTEALDMYCSRTLLIFTSLTHDLKNLTWTRILWNWLIIFPVFIYDVLFVILHFIALSFFTWSLMGFRVLLFRTCKHIMRSNASLPSPDDADDSDQRDKPDGIRMQIDWCGLT